MKNLLLISLLGLLSLSASSQQYGWRDISANLPDFPYDTAYNIYGDTILCLFTDVFFISDDEGWITTYHTNNDSAAILHTTDGGLTFEVQITMFSTNAIQMLNENEGYAGGSSGFVYRTTDGGENWILHGSIGTTLVDISFPPSGDMGYCCGFNGNIWSINSSGVTKMTSNINGNLLGINFPINSEEGWVVGGSVIRHYASNIWNGDQDMPSGFYNAICMTDNMNGWAVGDAGAIISTIDGHNWQTQHSQAYILTDIYFLTVLEGWAIGSGGTILHTINGGIDWNGEAEGLNNSILNGVHFTSSTNGYVVGNDKSLLKYSKVSGIADNELEELEFEVFPNPCQSKLTIKVQTSDFKYQISDFINLEGKTVKSIKLQGQENIIDLSDLPAGVYFIKLQTGEALGIRKIIIQ